MMFFGEKEIWDKNNLIGVFIYRHVRLSHTFLFEPLLVIWVSTVRSHYPSRQKQRI